MKSLREVLAGLIRVVVNNLEESKDDKEEVYYYSSEDFMGQSYIENSTNDTLIGNFHVPLRDKNGKYTGRVAWDSSAVIPTNKQDELEVLEHLIISIGTENNAITQHGAALSRAPGGFYKLNRAYKFYVIGSEGKANVTIKKIDDKRREVVVGYCRDFCQWFKT